MTNLIKKYLQKFIRFIFGSIKNDISYANYKRSLHGIMWERALNSSADYIEKNLTNALIFKKKEDLWRFAAKLINNSNLSQKNICLEFGVYNGYSINYFSKLLPCNTFYGFDSFEGLSVDWYGHTASKGTYTLKGLLPKTNKNVKLIKGWFDDTIHIFFKENIANNHICFVHIDSDTFEACEVVLNILKKSITKNKIKLCHYQLIIQIENRGYT